MRTRFRGQGEGISHTLARNQTIFISFLRTFDPFERGEIVKKHDKTVCFLHFCSHTPAQKVIFYPFGRVCESSFSRPGRGFFSHTRSKVMFFNVIRSHDSSIKTHSLTRRLCERARINGFFVLRLIQARIVDFASGLAQTAFFTTTFFLSHARKNTSNHTKPSAWP